MVQSRGYKGHSPEIVLVGFQEICCLGFADNKHRWLKDRSLNTIDLALKMGILEYRTLPQELERLQLFEIQAPPKNPDQVAENLPADECIRLDETNASDLAGFNQRWQSYILNHTGLRRCTQENCGFDPNNWQTVRVGRVRKTGLSREELDFLKSCNLQLEDVHVKEDTYDVTVVNVVDEPFLFKLDIGGPLPTGWRFDNLGLPTKEVRKMNAPLLLVHEAAYHVLLQATLHPAQTLLTQLFDPKKITFHAPTAMGPMLETERMGLDSFHQIQAKPKQLSHSLINTALGYLAPHLGIKGKISAHVGACESIMGGLGDAFRDLQSGVYDAALVVGYDWANTGVTYNGFSANGAFITNEQIVRNAKCLIEKGILADPEIISSVERILSRDQKFETTLKTLKDQLKGGQITSDEAQTQKRQVNKERILNFHYLPKKLYEMASTPFHRNRGGFVMSIGAGGGFFTTLDKAVEFGLPIQAILAGVGEKIPDGPTKGSIADLGDGVGDAFERAFLETRCRYEALDENGWWRDLNIDDIGVWWAHGTATPINGYGERREINRICEKYNRNPSNPLLITGDKEIGHRIGGNFPSEVCFMFDENLINPYQTYTLADEEVDHLFPLTQVVGPAGAGQGKPLKLQSDYIAVNGAGFGKINTNLIFKRFDLDDIELTQQEKGLYQEKLRTRLKNRQKTQSKIRQGETRLIPSPTKL